MNIKPGVIVRKRKVMEIPADITDLYVRKRQREIAVKYESSEKDYRISPTVKDGLTMTGA